MAIVSNITDPTAMALAQNSAKNAGSAQALQDQFMKLLITQLKNQDPLNPMENAELTSQLAQISTVEGISNLKDTILAISGQIDVSQSLNAASMIGKGILVPGTKVQVGAVGENGDERAATPFGVDVQADAATVTVKILDASGAAVRTMELGAQDAGVISLDWDGKNDSGVPVAEGAYTVQVNALNTDKNKVAAEPLSYGKVNSVSYGASGLRLDLGLAGQFSLFEVRKIIGLADVKAASAAAA